MSTLEGALAEWRAAIGADHVVTAPAALARAEAATFATTARVPAILRPGNREEVRTCLRTASRFRVPVYPVSGGRNWGYGSRVPAADGCVLLELGRLDRIVAFDPRLAWVSVEPGVTFRRLHEFLAERKAPLFIAATGSSPEASLVGTALERGDGAGPLGDLFQHACALEVVLPTGECVRTGLARFPEASAAPLHRWGVGPALDGLFSQSNLGVVTQMTFWLSPLPGHFQLFLATVRRQEKVESLADALQDLCLRRILDSPIYLWNDVKALSLLRRYPWAAAGGRTPLPEVILERFRSRAWGARWYACGALYSPDGRVGGALRRLVRRALRPPSDRLAFVTPVVAALARLARAPYRWLTGRDLGRLAAYRERNPFLGWPLERNLATAYWRKKESPAAMNDPDRDRCGFLWISVALPFRGADLRRAEEIALPVFREHGFEPSIAAVAISPRCLYFLPAVVYDRDAPGDDDRARACHDRLLAELIRAGYYPFRLGIQSMDALPGAADDSGAVLSRLKQALDPDRILSPGRYEFNSSEER